MEAGRVAVMGNPVQDQLGVYAGQLLRRLAGATSHHGTYDDRSAKQSQPGKKVEIKGSARTIKSGGATLELWRRHLEGSRPLGICPLMEGDRVAWGAIDVDAYDADLAAIFDAVEKEKLPLCVCRSKSGGAHLFLFLEEPVSASEMRSALKGMAARLGMPSATEIFPKQSKAEETQWPSWLNMPYFGGEETNRYCVKKGGMVMTTSEFINWADKNAIMAGQMSNLCRAAPSTAPSSTAQTSDFEPWFAVALQRLSNAEIGKADDTLMGVARDIGRWASEIAVDVDNAEHRARQSWHRRGKNDADFDAQWLRNITAGMRLGQPPRAIKNGDAPRLTRLSEVPVTQVEWLWPNRFAIGKLSLLAGHPGLGKSQLTMFLAATVSNGGEWPFREGFAEQGRTLVLSAEDDVSDTLKPRFLAAGGDAEMVDVLDAVKTRTGERGFDLSTDVEMLDRTLGQRGDYRLVIIDPISAYLGGKVDSNRNSDVRGVLAPVQKLAERHRVAVVCVSHLIKAGGREAIGSVTGSGAFVAAARLACIVAKEMVEAEGEDGKIEKVETGRRLLTVAKNNIGPDGADQSLAFRVVSRDIGNGIFAPAIEWDEQVSISADAAIGFQEQPKPGRRPSAMDDAKAFLRRTLKGGRMLSAELDAAAANEGISTGTLKNAKKAVGVISNKENASAGRWWCFMPGMQEELPL
ncbi:AAA family ATPase [Mesorhizobium sp. M0317]|uniref:AAA family ATPase n=1 Tax=Mesorhizobium sp. M0317 TaxID=2956935 RepID=UPI00333D8589